MSAVSERVYALRRMASLLGRRPGGFITGVAMCAAALAIPLFVAALLQAAWPWSQRLHAGPEIAVFVALGTPPRQLEALQSRLSALEGVQAVRLIPRDQAYAELSKRAGLTGTETAGGAVRRNPLPDVLIARFALGADPGLVDRSATTVRSWPDVDAVQSGGEWHRRLLALARAAGAVVAIIGAFSLGLIVLALAAAAYAQVQVRSDENRLLRLVGARTSFIVRPFAYAGALTLGLGSALGLAAATAALLIVEPRLQALAAQLGLAWTWPQIPIAAPIAWCTAALLVGWAAGWIGARLAIRADGSM